MEPRLTNLKIDEKREEVFHGFTGIYVRAHTKNGVPKTIDIAELTWDSVEVLIEEWGSKKLLKSCLRYYS